MADFNSDRANNIMDAPTYFDDTMTVKEAEEATSIQLSTQSKQNIVLLQKRVEDIELKLDKVTSHMQSFFKVLLENAHRNK